MLKLADELVAGLKKPTIRERIWAAGIFEGEGTVTIGIRNNTSKGKRAENYRLICMVGSTDVQIINFFHARWGGWLRRNIKRPGRKPASYWTVNGPLAHHFIESILPFIVTLRVRRKMRLGLDFRLHQSGSKRVWSDPDYKVTQRQAYFEMKELNRRGVVEDAEAR